MKEVLSLQLRVVHVDYGVRSISAEEADFVMVKPALAYMDVISLLRRKLTVPIVAYNVSGEYSMVKAAAQKMVGISIHC